MDTDVIIVNPVDKLPDSVGFVRPGRLGSGVLKFNNKGNQYLADCINEYFTNYRSNTHAWGFVGPKLLKRIWLSKYPSCSVPDPPAENIASSSSSSTGSSSSSTGTSSSQLANTDGPSSNCPFHVLWQDVYYPNVDNCFVVTPNVSFLNRQVPLILSNCSYDQLHSSSAEHIMSKFISHRCCTIHAFSVLFSGMSISWYYIMF